MNPENFIVRPHRRHLEKYGSREQWQQADPGGCPGSDISTWRACRRKLPKEDETAKRFDLLILNLQLALLEKSTSFARYRDTVIEIAAGLEGQGDHPDGGGADGADP